MDTVVAVLGLQLLEHARQVAAEVAAVSALREQRQARGNGEAAGWTLLQGTERWEAVPVGRLSANSPEMLMRLARAGAGIAALPDGFVQSAVREGALRRVLPGWQLPSSTAWAVYPGRKLMPPKTRAMVDMLQMALSGCSR